MPQRHRELPGELDQYRTNRLSPVNVLVGVEVGGIPADKAAEGGELASRFLRHRRYLIRRDHFVRGQPGPLSVDPLAQVEVQADTEVPVFS
jgi:hypothetical protein